MAHRPNILFILTDQQRRDTMRCYGNDWIEAPNMNRLADQGFVFENAYVTQPVCTPARASIMTGLYPHTVGTVQNGIPLPAEARTIAELVPEEYVCAHYGKWHLGNETVRQHGFEHWLSIEDSHRRDYDRREHRSAEANYIGFLRRNGVKPPAFGQSYESWVADVDLPAELTQAAFLGAEASRFIREHTRSQTDARPFMLYVSFFEPHPPYTGPLNGLYDPQTIPVGPAFVKRPVGGALVNRLRADYYMAGNLNPLGVAGGDVHDTTSEAGWRKLRAQYMANVTLVDRNLGLILDALDEAAVADDTLVVFTSEHGEMAGDHGMLEKRSLYEEAARVPLLIRAPWLGEAPGRIGGSLGQVDLVPTILEMVGTPRPRHLQGVSRVPVLEGDATLEQNDVFIQWNGVGDRDLGTPAINRMMSVPWRSVVTGDRWKLNLSPGDQCELYDLSSDPYEQSNLFNLPEHRDRVRDLTARIRLWQHETGDAAPLPPV